MAELAPSILSADFSRLGEDVAVIERAGAQLIHVDVMDGHFVPNISYGSTVMKSLLGKTHMPFDVHLMIENPEKYIEDFVTDNTRYITVHAEAAGDTAARIDFIHSLGIKAGIAINPGTSTEAALDVLEQVDIVLVMSVNPGFGGQKFMGEVLAKTTEFDRLRKERGFHYVIEMDGGIGLDNLGMVLDAGTDIVVAGSSIFRCEDVPGRVGDFLKRM